MTRANPDRTLDTLGHRILRASELYPDVLGALREQRTHVNALRASVGGGGGSDISDPTGRTVIALDRISRLEGDISDAIATLGVCVNMLRDAMETAIGYRAPDVQVPTCAEPITLEPGVVIACGRYVEYTERPDGSVYYRDKCARCRKAEQRAKREDAA